LTFTRPAIPIDQKATTRGRGNPHRWRPLTSAPSAIFHFDSIIVWWQTRGVNQFSGRLEN
jgi:hypothetical protein